MGDQTTGFDFTTLPFPNPRLLNMKYTTDYPTIGSSGFQVLQDTILLMTAFVSSSHMALSIMLWAMLSNIGAGKALKDPDKLSNLK